MLTMERRNKLAEILVSSGKIRINDVAEKFSVSNETIRKDLIYLEEKGIAKRSHGGAIAATEFVEPSFSEKAKENVEYKKKIAKVAIELIPDKGVILLDSGSTTFEIAKLLSIKTGLTIITNSLNIAQILSKADIELYLVGGEVRKTSKALVGMWALDCLDMINSDIAFLGSSGFRTHNGPCIETYYEAQVKKTMISNTKQSVVVSDSSKFNSNALFEYVSWDKIDILVTDNRVSEDKLKDIKELTEVIVAE